MITTSQLETGVVETAYSASLAASGGASAYTWTTAAGVLPAGLELSSDGTIAGVPSAVGESSFTVRVESGGQSAQKELAISIFEPLVIVTTSLPDAVLSQSYSQPLSASGGGGGNVWSLSVGVLPTGLTLDGSAGIVSGTPTVEETQGFTVEVVSSDAQTVRQALSITVSSGKRNLAPTEYCSDFLPTSVATFAHVELESAVRSSLHVGGGTELTCDLLGGLTLLDAEARDIDDIAGIQNLVGLEELHLDENFAISDLQWLSELTSLTVELDLSQNAITDVTPLSGLTSLQDLNLANNAIADIDALSGLTAVVALNLNGNPISDPSPLANLAALENLDLAGTEVTDFSALAGLPALTSLEARDNGLTTTSTLGGLTGVTILDLSGNALTDIASLRDLTDLTFLNLRDNVGLSDISPLLNNSGLGSGDTVELRGTSVSCTDVAALEALGVIVRSDCP